MTFNEFKRKLDKRALKQVIEEAQNPFTETYLFRKLFPKLKLSSLNSLELYRYHFTIFYYLYQLQREFHSEHKFLYIHFMRFSLRNFPKPNKCNFYIEEKSDFCKNNTSPNEKYCKKHLHVKEEIALDNLSNKYFYFDENNFNQVKEKNILNFYEATKNLISNYPKINESFRVLELPENSNLEEVKTRFRILALELHPDKNPDTSDKFKKINNAYRFLKRALSKN